MDDVLNASTIGNRAKQIKEIRNAHTRYIGGEYVCCMSGLLQRGRITYYDLIYVPAKMFNIYATSGYSIVTNGYEDMKNANLQLFQLI